VAATDAKCVLLRRVVISNLSSSPIDALDLDHLVVFDLSDSGDCKVGIGVSQVDDVVVLLCDNGLWRRFAAGHW
jgi:hypothetical protein